MTFFVALAGLKLSGVQHPGLEGHNFLTMEGQKQFVAKLRKKRKALKSNLLHTEDLNLIQSLTRRLELINCMIWEFSDHSDQRSKNKGGRLY